MDYKTVICLFLIVILALLMLVNKIDDNIINFSYLDKSLIMRGIWFVFSSIFFFLFFIFKPFYIYIEKNKKNNSNLINGTLKNVMKNTPYAGIVDFILGTDSSASNPSASGKMGDALNLFDNINHLKRLVDIEARISSSELKNSKPISSDNIDKYILTDKNDKEIIKSEDKSNKSSVKLINRKNKKNTSDSSDLLNYLVQISSSLENDKSLLIDKNTKTSGNLVTDTNDLLKFTNISEISDSSFNYNSRSNDETESNYSSLSEHVQKFNVGVFKDNWDDSSSNKLNNYNKNKEIVFTTNQKAETNTNQETESNTNEQETESNTNEQETESNTNEQETESNTNQETESNTNQETEESLTNLLKSE